jgi:hypothetical protein
MQLPLTIPGRSVGEVAPLVSAVAASDNYFSVLRVPLVRGRAFTPTDGRPGSEAAIVNQRFVRMFLPDVEPIGARIRLGAPNAPLMQIVGVAVSVRQQIFGPEPDPVVFVPFRSLPAQTAAIIVRTASDPTIAVAAMRNEVTTLDSNLPVYRVMSFEQAARNAVWNGRLSDTLIKSIAVVALLLALIGIYAVTGHTVQRWTRELGLRMALGAEAGQIGWLVLRRILWQLGIGLSVGIAATFAFDRLLNDPANAAAYGIWMTDPIAMVLIMLSIAAIAVISCVVLIRRAARLDPVEALRT